jgi:membrane associated rhomboid family serine protease
MIGRRYKLGATEILVIINAVLFLPYLLRYIGIDLPFALVYGLGALQIDPDLWFQTQQTFNPVSGPQFSIQFFNGGAVWQALTAAFLHGGFFHLLFNMYLLFMLGKFLETRWGAAKFTTFYLTIAILANVLTGILYMIIGQPLMLIGASGAMYGVLLAFGNYYPDAQFRLFFMIPIKAKWLILGYLAMDVILGFGQGAGGIQTGIAHATHVSGFLFGFLYLLVIHKENAIKNMFFRNRNTYYYS